MKKIAQNKTLRLKFYQRDKQLGNSSCRYSGPFLKLTREELWQMDQMTRKLMIMLKTLQLSNNLDYMCQEKMEEKGLNNIEDSMNASIQRLKDYNKKSKKDFLHWLVTALTT